MSHSSNAPVYLPLLHTSMVPHGFAPHVRCLWPGLPGMPPQGYMPVQGPFTPERAAQSLKELNQLAAEGAKGSPVFTALAPKPLPGQEQAALHAFQGGADSASPQSLKHFEESQWMLLIAWNLEAQVAEIRATIARYAQQSQQLDEALADEPQAGQLLAAQAASFLHTLMEGGEALLPSWRMLCEHAAPFIPPDSLMVSADASMLEDLHEAGLLAPDAACAVSPPPGFDTLRQQLAGRYDFCCLRASFGQLLGQTGPHPDKNWLDSLHYVLMCKAHTPI